ncbi:unnamed protein product [Prunus armeniaca]|uniref:Uncharacterized protein n=1 Tax=Prunus armeniaca TaxID=36596 RepID=A0A6J5XZK2_PRUAR|nr:unnamed protein product [Prunus armeniaca]
MQLRLESKSRKLKEEAAAKREEGLENMRLELFEKSSEEREKKKIRALNSFPFSSSSPTTMVRQPKSEDTIQPLSPVPHQT